MKFLLNIATKPGSLRNIDRTIKAALMAAIRVMNYFGEQIRRVREVMS